MDGTNDLYQQIIHEDKHDNFIELQNHCPLCSNELNIKVTSLADKNTIKEEAFCDNCNIKTRSKDHKYH